MNNPFPDPFKLFSAQMYVTAMAIEASAVIGMRMLGMSGLWAVPNSENSRMISEKQVAFAKSSQKAFIAAMSGKTADVVMMEAAKPLRRRTSANHKRLTHLGPKTF